MAAPDDWDRPFTDDELQAIDAVFQSAGTTSTLLSSSPPIRKRQASTPPPDASDNDGSDQKIRRRLPESLFGSQQQDSHSFALSACRKSFNFHCSSSTSSYKGNLKMRYQEMGFKGKIVYSRTVAEVEKSAEELLNFVEFKRRKEGQVILGFDIEWRPTFRRGVAPGKAAVMQICGDSSICYVMHIIHSGISRICSVFWRIQPVKVGVCISNDAAKVFDDHNVLVKTLEDLSDLANQKLGACKKWSLSALTEMLVCKQLPKPNNIRLGNWEADVLSNGQLHYAATDAFVSWYLYQVLKNLPDTANTESKEPAAVAPE